MRKEKHKKGIEWIEATAIIGWFAGVYLFLAPIARLINNIPSLPFDSQIACIGFILMALCSAFLYAAKN